MAPHIALNKPLCGFILDEKSKGDQISFKEKCESDFSYFTFQLQWYMIE